MTRYEKAMKLKNEDFKQLIGVKKETYEKMLIILKNEYKNKHRKGGRKPKLSIEDQLFLSLKYMRQYVTQKELSFEFEVGEATTNYIIKWIENTLLKSGEFSLPSKKALIDNGTLIDVILIDATETPIERPKKTKKLVLWKKEKTYYKISNCHQC